MNKIQTFFFCFFYFANLLYGQSDRLVLVSASYGKNVLAITEANGDVIWSYKTLGVEGHWRYRGLWSKISSAIATGPRSVTFTFSDPNPELALLAGMRPILKKAQWQGLDFSASAEIGIRKALATPRMKDVKERFFIE